MTVGNEPHKERDTSARNELDGLSKAALNSERQESSQANESKEKVVMGGDELETLRAEVEQWKDKFLRAKAEQQNAIRRAENETRDAVRFANANVLRSLIEIVDDLDRTIEAVGDGGRDDALFEGVRLIQDKVGKFLADNGVTAFNAVGEPFDPAHHEALMQQSTDEFEAGTVMEQMQTGYMHRDRVLRPAKVIVAAALPGCDTDKGAERE